MSFQCLQALEGMLTAQMAVPVAAVRATRSAGAAESPEEAAPPGHQAAIEAAFWESQAAARADHDVHAAAILGAMYAAVLSKIGVNSVPRVTLGFVSLVLPALASLAVPRWYRASSHRCWVVAATRLGTAFLLTNVNELAATGAFDSVAIPGQALRKVLGGCRVAPLILMTVAYPLPLPWVAWVQLAAVAKAAAESRRQLCQVPQLASPVVKQLVLRMAGAVRWAGLFSRALSFAPAGWRPEEWESGAWERAAASVDAGDWCFLLALWLQLMLGYALPLLLRWSLTARARQAFYREHCRQRSCGECLAAKGADVAGTSAALVVMYVLLALTVWEVLFASHVAAHL
jgi:hypothetical protein